MASDLITIAKQLADLARRMERLEDGFADHDRIGGFRRLEDSILTERAARNPKYMVEMIHTDSRASMPPCCIKCGPFQWNGLDWLERQCWNYTHTDAQAIADHLRTHAILPKEQA